MVLWEVSVRLHFISPAAFASPMEILARLPSLFSEDHLYVDIWITLRRSLSSASLGFLAGILFAVVLYLLGPARSSGEFVLDFLRSIPITSLLPIFITIVGVGESSKVAIGAAGAMLMSATTIWIGIRESLHCQRVLLHIYRPTLLKRIAFVLIPDNIATLLTAAKLSVSAGLVLVIVSEMFLGSRGGLGKVINDMSYGDDRAGQFATVFCAGIIGYGLNIALDSIIRFARKNPSFEE